MGTTGTVSYDITKVGQIASSVNGVEEAVAIVDHKLKVDAGRQAEPAVARPTGSPMPGDQPALVSGPAPNVPAGAARTLTEALQQAASISPTRGTTYVLADGSTDRQTYEELLQEALRLLTGLQGTSLRPGDPVLLQCGDNRTFVTAFWACILGGFVPTAVAPAPDYRTDNAVLRRLKAAWELLGNPPVLADADLHGRVAELGRGWSEEFQALSVAELASDTPAEPFPAGPDHPVVNLLTSGSTGTPKCVQHAHRTIVARTYAAIDANDFTEDDISLNWMPLDHVGGMVMFNVRDVFLRCEHVNARTDAMIRRPLNWVDWIDRFKATNTWAPNFAFALVNKHSQEIESGHWDLSSMRNICNAGEAVVARTALRFVELLAPHGLPADAMVPCWGMSETSSGVTYSRLDLRDATVGTVALDPASLEGQLAEADPGAAQSVTLTEVGSPVAGVSLRIVDDDGEVLPEGRVGHLHITGDTVMNGYVHNDAANAASFTGDGWFDTGDLGFLRNGRLTLTGRQKNMVIVNGANYPAHEVEAVVELVPGVQPGCAAVCGVQDEDSGTDAILVFFVPAENATGSVEDTVAGIRSALARDISLRPNSIIPVTSEEFPRQPGGKIQRERLLDAMREGRFDGRMHSSKPESEETNDSWMLEPIWVPTERLSAESLPTIVYASASATWPRSVPGVVGVINAVSAFRIGCDGQVAADLADPEQNEEALRYLVELRGAPARIIYAVDTEPETLESSPAERFLVTLATMAGLTPDAELQVVTQGALAVQPSDEPQPERAALTGLVRTAVAEGMLGAVRMVDASRDAEPGELVQLAGERYADDVVGVRAGKGYVAKLRMLDPSQRFDVPPDLMPARGIALVTGGLGALGRLVAEQLLVSSDARVLVVGRTPEAELTAEAAEALRELAQLGDVIYSSVDVADPAGLAHVVALAEAEWNSRLGLVVHAAGAAVAPQWTDLSAHDLHRESTSWLREMMRPKLGGCASIDELVAERPDVAIVLFSSVNGFLGGSGFGAYAAANAAVDGYARLWSGRGRRVHCLAWSMWSGRGMNDGSPLVAAAQRRGLRLIDPADGLSLLLTALHEPQPYLLVGADPSNASIKGYLAPDQFSGGSVVVGVVPEGEADPDAVKQEVAATLAETGAFTQVVVLPQIPRTVSGAVDPVALLAARETGESDYQAPEGELETVVAGVVSEVLELGRVGRDDSFFSLGCDSIRAVQVVARLTERLDRDVTVARLYESPTVRELADAITGS